MSKPTDDGRNNIISMDALREAARLRREENKAPVLRPEQRAALLAEMLDADNLAQDFIDEALTVLERHIQGQKLALDDVKILTIVLERTKIKETAVLAAEKLLDVVQPSRRPHEKLAVYALIRKQGFAILSGTAFPKIARQKTIALLDQFPEQMIADLFRYYVFKSEELALLVSALLDRLQTAEDVKVQGFCTRMLLAALKERSLTDVKKQEIFTALSGAIDMKAQYRQQDKPNAKPKAKPASVAQRLTNLENSATASVETIKWSDLVRDADAVEPVSWADLLRDTPIATAMTTNFPGINYNNIYQAQTSYNILQITGRHTISNAPQVPVLPMPQTSNVQGSENK